MAPSLNIFPISPHQAESGWGYGSLKDRELGGDALPGDGTPGVSVMLVGGESKDPRKTHGPTRRDIGKTHRETRSEGARPAAGLGLSWRALCFNYWLNSYIETH